MTSPFVDKEQKRLFLTLLKVMGGRKAEVAFSGGGDSGTIDDAVLLDQDDNPIDLSNATFDWHEHKGVFNEAEDKWEKTFEKVPNKPVKDILTQICEDALEETGHDWYNNDGGQGSLTIDLTTTPPVIELNVEINYMHHDSHNYDYTDEEDEEGEPTQYADLTAEDRAREELIKQLKGAK